jgi:hypothetical protein
MNEGRCWLLWAHDCESGKDGHGRYRHIGAKKYVEIHGLPYPIVAVAVREAADGDYWGWLKTGEAVPTMIWPSWAQFTICFPYGPEVEVKRGNGEILRLCVAERNV